LSRRNPMKAEIRIVALESDLSRRNQMKAEGTGKTGELFCLGDLALSFVAGWT
jgi:hypothetical protein